MPKATKAPVTPRALLQRVNRKLAEKDEMVRKNRGFFDGSRDLGRGPLFNELGEYFLIDTRRDVVSATDVNLETLGRELGVLAPWEGLVEEEEAKPKKTAKK